jgi:hypothetical protein
MTDFTQELQPQNIHLRRSPPTAVMSVETTLLQSQSQTLQPST